LGGGLDANNLDAANDVERKITLNGRHERDDGTEPTGHFCECVALTSR
jgi:hypothetical protein